MTIKINIKGKICRYYIAGDVWVSKDGKHMYIQNGKYYIQMNINIDANGKYISHPLKGRVNVAEAVLTCFCPPKPADDKRYMAGYKDGNKSNCDRANLEWVPFQPQSLTIANSILVVKDGKRFTVHKNGTIKSGKQQEHISNCFGDADTDTMFVAWNPTVSGSRGKINVDEIMVAAGYVHGDKEQFKAPVILHKDYDWMNFASDNLEWAEGDDARVVEYKKKKDADRQALWQQLNPHLSIDRAPYKI